MIIDEMVLAIDPALHKVEEILLWQNKFKTGAVFTFFHFLFWLFQNFNIRTYCTISCVLLVLHLLDAYRTKKRREILRLQQSSKSKSKFWLFSKMKEKKSFIFQLNPNIILYFCINYSTRWIRFCQINKFEC